MVLLTPPTEAEDSLLESLVFSPPKNNYCTIEQDKSSHSENDDDDDTGGSGISNEEEDSSSNSSSNSNTSEDDCKGGSATIVSTTISMTKNLLGAGVLSLSSGIALFSTSTTKRNGNTDGSNGNGDGDSEENDVDVDDDRLVASTPTAILISISIILLLGILLGYFCLLIAKVCEKTNSKTYRDCWEKTIGSKSRKGNRNTVWTQMSGIFVSIVCMLLPAQGNIASAVVLSETFQSLLTTFFTSYDIKIELSRTICLLILTFVVFIPMCLMKDINALSGFSMVGVLGMIIVTISMVIRFFDGSYQPGGRYYYIGNGTDHNTTEQQQQFYPEQHEHRQQIIHNKYDLSSSSLSLSVSSLSSSISFSFSLVNLYKDRMMKILPFVCMVFNSCIMHYNTPRFYMELKDRSIRRFTLCVVGSFGLSAMLSVIIGLCGYVTFHTDATNTNGIDQRPPTSISSYILNNYSSYDKLAIISRIGIFISTLLMYPLAFFGVRDGFLDIYQGIRILFDSSSSNNNTVHRTSNSSNNNNNNNNKEDPKMHDTRLISFFLLFLLTLGAIVFNDLGLINAVGGGTLATLLCIFFPVIMYRDVVVKKWNKNHNNNVEERKENDADDDAELQQQQQQQQQQQYIPIDSTTPTTSNRNKEEDKTINTTTENYAELQESYVALFLMMIGILLGTLGVYQSLVSSSSSSN